MAACLRSRFLAMSSIKRADQRIYIAQYSPRWRVVLRQGRRRQEQSLHVAHIEVLHRRAGLNFFECDSTSLGVEILAVVTWLGQRLVSSEARDDQAWQLAPASIGRNDGGDANITSLNREQISRVQARLLISSMK